MDTKIWLITAGVCIALATTSCDSDKMNHDASGIFEATEVIVSARGTGELIEFNIVEGQKLKAGQVCGFIDTLQMDLKRKQLSAGLSATSKRKVDEKQQVSALTQQINNMKKEQERFKKLLEQEAIAQKQYDDLCYQIEVLECQLDAAKERLYKQNGSVDDQLDAFDAQMEELNYHIRNCYIKSPINGTVMTKYAQEGEFAAPGRILFRIANTDEMTLRAYITSEMLSEISLGQTVKVYTDAGRDDYKEFSGTITWISEKAEFTPKNIQTRNERANLVYAIKVTVVNNGSIKKGMYGEVDLQKE